jgi:hypothetical protein
MGSIVNRLIKERETTYEGNWICDGCWNAIRFTLFLTYNENSVANCDDKASNI